MATAIAEVAATATDTAAAASSTGFGFNFNTIFSLIIVGYCFLQGFASLITGKTYGLGKSAERYTDESLGKFARPYGLAEILFGAGLCCVDAFLYYTNPKNITFLWIGIAGIVLGAVMLVVAYKKLVKKTKA